MNEVVEAHVATKNFMGSVLGEGGDVVFEQSYGWASVEWSIPNTATTKFRIGSVTKQFTAAAILLPEERGKLAVEDPIAKHVPEAPDSWKDITLFHLLATRREFRASLDFPSTRRVRWGLSAHSPDQEYHSARGWTAHHAAEWPGPAATFRAN